MSEVVLKDLPEDWAWSKLGDVVTKIIGGGTPSKNTPKYWDGDIPWLTVKDMRTRRPVDAKDHISEKGVKESSTNIIPEDTVIIATRIGLGKVIRVPYKAAINQDLKALVVPPEIEKGYLEYWFVSKTNSLESIGSGTTVKGIRLEQVRDLDFPLAPPEQQKRIVAKIEELFSHIDVGIEALKKAKQLLKQYRQSVLKAAVTGELTEEWREINPQINSGELIERIKQEKDLLSKDSFFKRHKDGKKVNDDEKFSSIPNAWQWVRMADVCLKITDGAHNTPKTLDDGARYITAKDLTGGELDFSSEKYISEKEHKELFNKCRPESGDILIVNIGAGSGNAVLIPNDIDFEFSFKNIAILKLSKEMNSSYIYWYQIYRKEIIFLERTRGGAQPFLSLAILNDLVVPLPPREEQEVIAALIETKLSFISRLEKDLDIQMKRAEVNKQSILAFAFSGNLHD